MPSYVMQPNNLARRSEL